MQFLKSQNSILLLLVATLAVVGCGRKSGAIRVSSSQVNCMARAMYFESNRSSRDGMIAVGSVVMNRVASSEFPNSVCAVVGQKNQFAPGVLSKPMNDSGRPLAEASAAAVLRGERHPNVGSARFFHAAWYQANFNNIHYVVTTGGNAFYEKRRPENVTRRTPLPNTEGVTRG
ncbi:MAG: cell wall hydrolase [Pseudomonadota bacterium]